MIDLQRDTKIIGYAPSSQISIYVGKSLTAGLQTGQLIPANIEVLSGLVNLGPVDRILAQPSTNTLNAVAGAITVNPGVGTGTINFRGGVRVQSGADLIPQSLTQTRQLSQFSKLETDGWIAFGCSNTFLQECDLRILELEAGPLLIDFKKDYELVVSKLKIKVSRGTLLRLERRGDVISVTNLADEKKQSCSVKSAGMELCIPVGHMLYTSSTNLTGIPKRRVEKLTGDMRIAEISLLSHFLNDKLLKHVLRTESSLKTRLVKVAAILGVVTAAHGAFEEEPVRPQI